MKTIYLTSIIALLSKLRLGLLLEKVIAAERVARVRKRLTAEKDAKIGDLAVVQNLSLDRSRIRLGKNSVLDGELLVHDYGGQIEIGDFTYIGQGSRIWSGDHVRVGSRVFIAHNVNITDTNSHQIDAHARHEHFLRTVVRGQPFEKDTIETAPVVIGNDVWINFNVGILKGVTIGEGAIIGACSLVTKDVPPYTFVAGNPLRVIRELPGKRR